MKKLANKPVPKPTWNDIFKEKKWGTYPSEAVVREVLSLPHTGGHALDLGCGAGANTVFLAENGYEVRAVDSSREALHQAEKLCIRKGVDDRVEFSELDYINTDNTSARIPPMPYNLILDWLSLAHQPKNKIIKVMNQYYLTLLSADRAYIVGLFGIESSQASFAGVPMPSLFSKEEVVALLDDIVRRYSYPVIKSKFEETSYTRNGNRVQVWCLVFTRD